ncbi:MAG TPA: tetratricopeptide repeat protein [Myxococcales bacterium]|nr:tetratricopeptide repeat protein [Myxococcales bacterium]
MAEGLLWAALFFCPLALGTFQGWSIAVMLALACAALAAAAWATGRVALPVVGLGLAAVAGYVGLQAVPLPPWLLRLLSPQGAETYRFALGGLAPAGWHPLTLDGPGTARELVKALAEAAAFLAAWQVASSRRARRRLALAIAASGLAIALIGYGHLLANAHELFGLPIFKEAAPPFVTTFGNKNNAAGFLSLCAPVMLGLALRGGDRRAQALYGLGYVLIGAAVFLCLSRGAICAFLVAQLALGAWLWVNRERPQRSGAAAKPARSPRAAVAAICAAAAAVSIAAFLGYEPVVARLATLDSVESLRQETKLQGFAESLPLLRDFPLTGIGRGAFPTVGGHYLTAATGTAEFIEDEPLQAVAELGWPVGGALLLLLAWAFVRALSQPGTGPLEHGLAAGLLALGLQNLVDFSLELGGVALPALVALACLCRRPQDAPPATTRSIPGWMAAGGALAALALGLLVFPRSLEGWRGETDAFVAAAPALTSAQAEKAALPLLERHPASFVVPLALAERFLAERRPGAALHWLNRALYFKPNVAAMHLVAEGALADLGRKAQCLLEARLYFEQTGDYAGLVTAMRKYPSLEDLEQAVPGTGAALASLGAFLRNARRPADALAATRAGLALEPTSAAIHLQLASLLAAQRDLAGAVAEARRACALAPDDPEASLQLSSVLLASGKPADARAALDGGLHRRPGQPQLVFALVELLLSQHDPQQADRALDELGAAATLAERAQGFAERARIYVAEGRVAKAEQALRTAARLQPSYEWQLVDLLEGQSRLPAAIQLLQELAAGSSGDTRAGIEQRIASDGQRLQALDQARREATLLAPPSPP